MPCSCQESTKVSDSAALSARRGFNRTERNKDKRSGRRSPLVINIYQANFYFFPTRRPVAKTKSVARHRYRARSVCLSLSLSLSLSRVFRASRHNGIKRERFDGAHGAMINDNSCIYGRRMRVARAQAASFISRDTRRLIRASPLLSPPPPSSALASLSAKLVRIELKKFRYVSPPPPPSPSPLPPLLLLPLARRSKERNIGDTACGTYGMRIPDGVTARRGINKSPRFSAQARDSGRGLIRGMIQR